jgi:hypothetical protein
VTDEQRPEYDFEPHEETDAPAGGDETLFLAGTWKGLPMYRCPLCEHATVLGPIAMGRHIEKKHIAPPTQTLLLDRRGQPLTH